MPMEGRTTCAVPECGASISGHSNLCDSHRIPGVVVQVGDSTMVIGAWATEHEDESGVVLINDFALGDLFSGRAGFETRLKEQGFVNVRLLSTPEELAAAKTPAEGKKIGDWGGSWKTQYPWGFAKAPDRSGDPALDNASNYFGDLPEPSGQQKPEKPALTPATTVPDDDPSPTIDSPEKRTNELLAQISKTIYDRVAPRVAGTLTQGGSAELAPINEGFVWLRLMPQEMGRLLGSGSAEADVAAVVALFPPGVRALITAHLDARVHVSRSEGSLEVSISQCNEPAFLFQELSEPYDATHALHLVCDPGKDKRYMFVMVELSDGKFVPNGWVTGEEAARYSAEGAKSATGRPPDFRSTTGKSPK